MGHLNIIVANAAIKNGNRGCVALSVSTLFILNRILNDKHISHTFYLPQSGYDKMEEHTLKVGNLNLKFISLADPTQFTLRQKLKNLAHYKEYTKTLKAYKQADFIFDIGQGDSFADIYGAFRFNLIFDSYRLGMKFHKPYCILPQTIGPFKDPAIRKRACRGIEYASCVMARDRQSKDFVQSLLPDKKVTEVTDVAFFMPFERKSFDKRFTHVGLNVSALLWHGGYTRNNQFGLKADYQSLIRSIIDYFLKQDGIKLHLIPHVVGGERTLENDYAVSYDLYEEYHRSNLILSPLFLDPIAAKNYISGMNFFIGARMHSTIAAFSSGVPVVPMAYSRKFNGLFKDTLEYPYMVDMKMKHNAEILANIKFCYGQKEKLKEMEYERMRTTVEERRILMEKRVYDFLNIE